MQQIEWKQDSGRVVVLDLDELVVEGELVYIASIAKAPKMRFASRNASTAILMLKRFLERGIQTASILIADDDEAVSRIVRAVCELGGHQVTVASDGREALELAAKERFDLVITDLYMPRLDGVGLATRIRQLPLNKDTPIVGMSGQRERAEKEMRAAGLGAFLPKPLDVDKLRKVIDSFVPSLSDYARESLST